jgi:hypothetical protein
MIGNLPSPESICVLCDFMIGKHLYQTVQYERLTQEISLIYMTKATLFANVVQFDGAIVVKIFFFFNLHQQNVNKTTKNILK